MKAVVIAVVVLLTSSALAGPPCEYEDGAEKCKQKCDAGSQDSCAHLGVMLLRGDFGKKVDRAAAEKLLKGACAAKVPLGCGALGSMYVMQKDLKRGRPLLDQACKMGDPLSCESRGGLEMGALGRMPVDIPAAARRATVFYRRACELGSGSGCAFVAAFISDKAIDGTVQEALELYVKACSRGIGVACRSAVAVLQGNTPEHKALAAKLDVGRLTADLWRRGCEAGDSKSCEQTTRSP